MASANTTRACAQINRRSLLAALPAAAVAGSATASEETPVMRLFREWKRRRQSEEVTYKMHSDARAPESIAATNRVKAVEDRLFAEPATCLADMAIKLCVANGFGEWDMNFSDELWTEARALVA